MLKNEIYLFFSKKNILVLVGAVIVVLLLYQFQYMTEYQKYGMEQAQNCLEHEEDINTIVAKYKNQLAYYEEYEPDSNNISDVKKLYRVWQLRQAENRLLEGLWKQWESDDENESLDNLIRWQVNQMDQALVHTVELENNLGDDILYQQTRRGWKERMLLHNAYEEAGVGEPVNKATPTGAYVVWDALSGVVPVFLVFIIAIILWNYDIWSADFEESTYRLVYTLPYAREKIFRIRCFIHFTFSIIGVEVLLAVLFFRGTFSFGTGLNDFQLVNQRAINQFPLFFIDSSQTEAGDVAVSIGNAIGIRFLLVVLFLMFFMGIIQCLSFTLKNSTSVICVLTVVVTMVATIKLMSVDGENPALWERLNPFSYFQIAEIVHGDLGVGVFLVVVEEMVVMVCFLVGTQLWMRRREL